MPNESPSNGTVTSDQSAFGTSAMANTEQSMPTILPSSAPVDFPFDPIASPQMNQVAGETASALASVLGDGFGEASHASAMSSDMDSWDAATFVSGLADRITREIHKAVCGQDEVIEAAIVALLCGGHALLEGVPGTAKTLIARSIAASCQAEFKRIQFTPDLMPSDISGTNVLDMATSTFNLRRGPIFGEIVLADEINRTPPKTQAALLEAMEERHVSIDGTTNDLPPLFTVFATQNPVEYEGTYPLPEAQLDRFLVKVQVNYPSEVDEQAMLRAADRGFRAGNLATANIQPVATTADILRARAALPGVTVEPKIINYITTMVRRTREHRQLTLGASPRATVALLQASKTLALMRGRLFITPDDVKDMAVPVLRHRILLKPEAEIEGVSADRVLRSMIESVEVPR